MLIVTWTPGFPNSATADAVRVRAFASGLAAAGADVSVHVLATMSPGWDLGPASPAAGVWRGIPFEYMHGASGPVSGWLRRRSLEVRAAWRMVRTVRTAARVNRHTAVILFSPSLRAILPLRIACSRSRIPLVNVRDEFPFVTQRTPSPLARAYNAAYRATVFRMYEGHIVISALLEEFVRERARPGAWVLRVPILVSADEFACAEAPTPGLVGYAGNLSHTEELVGIVRAVATLAAEHPEVRARIMGGGSASEIAAVQREAERLGVADRVDLAGMFSPDDVPRQLCACAALALPRARGLFSDAGLPTKLGEYLATGRPVVVTATGDIPDYLRADTDAFVVPTGDEATFTHALERALFDPASAAVGLAGREVARTRFSPVAHMRTVLAALEDTWAGRVSAG